MQHCPVELSPTRSISGLKRLSLFSLFVSDSNDTNQKHTKAVEADQVRDS